MAYFSTEPASQRRNPTGKSRAWDFFRFPNKTHPANRRQPAQPRRIIRPTPTKTASGIPYWPSRDPIGEKGGKNLYGFVGNDGVDEIDILGNRYMRPTLPSPEQVAETSLTLEEAEAHWRGKSGTSIKIDFSELKTEDVRVLDFPDVSSKITELREKVGPFPECKSPNTVEIRAAKKSWSPSGDIWFVLGHVTLVARGTLSLECKKMRTSPCCACTPHFKGILKCFDDRYDFDMHPWISPKNWPGNVETIVGRMHAGDGDKFWIEIRGERKVDE